MNVCGICDFRKKVSLGSLLITVSLIKVYKKLFKNAKTELQIITKKKLDKNIYSISKSFLFVQKVSIKSKIILNEKNFYFQKIKNDNITIHEQNSTIHLQKILKKYNYENELFFNIKTEKYIKNILKKIKFIKIAVSLKLSNKNRFGNAKLNVWYEFFNELQNDKTIFYLIGNNQYPKKFHKLKNIKIISNKLSLLNMLAYSKNCDFFLGNATGISTINLLNNRPYVIFKHPNHHPKIFKRELLNKKKLLFQTRNQLIINNYENKKILLKYYEKFKKL